MSRSTGTVDPSSAQIPEEVQAAAVRKEDVQDHQIVAPGPNGGPPGSDVAGDLHHMASTAEGALEQLRGRQVVVDDKYRAHETRLGHRQS